MIDPNTLMMFIAASTALAFAPGPDNIFVLTQSIVNGRSAGIKITFGLCTGLIFHTTIVALGVSVIFQTSFVAFNILKFCGVAYLLFLAWKSLRASSSRIELGEKSALTSLQLYRRGIIMNITNPKVSIFFMAFLPQFTDPARGSITLQLIFLGIIFILVTIAVFSLISQLAGVIGRRLTGSARGERILNMIAGVVFVSLAIKLVCTGQK
jgi:threonine/homoserine/homoserine lactone efflux protein